MLPLWPECLTRFCSSSKHMKVFPTVVLLQLCAAPLQKLRGDVTHWSSCDKTQRHFLTNRVVNRTLLPENAIACESFGIRITLLPELFFQMDRMLRVRRQCPKRN
jgi:hypothetical protein